MNNDIIQQKSQSPAMATFAAVEHPRYYSDLIACPSPKFLPFAREHGQEALIGVVITVLSRITEALAYDVRPVMITEAARAIITDWPDTKLSDLLLFKSEVIAGRIGGKLFRWDARVIVETWREYYQNRENEFADFREKRQELAKRKEGEPDPIPLSGTEEELRKKLKENMERLAAIGAEERKKWNDDKAARSMSLEEICEYHGLNTAKIINEIRIDMEEDLAQATIPDESKPEFERFFFKRVLLKARQNPAVLYQYQDR